MTRDPLWCLHVMSYKRLFYCLPSHHNPPLKFTLTAINLPSLLPRGPDVRNTGWTGAGESLCGIHESRDPKIQVVKHAPQKQHPTL